MKNKVYLDCLNREEAQKLWITKLQEIGFFSNLPTEEVLTTDALDRVTAHTVYAKVSVPHYNGSAMDGIAVYAEDTFGAQENEPTTLKLLPEGEPFTFGCCYMVDTGDMMPLGTNAVIMIEDVQWEKEAAEIIAAAAPWQHVRIIGEDIAAHELVLPEHRCICPTDIAALLSAGLDTIEVLKKPTVAIIPTGDEIVTPGQSLEPGKIKDVNSYMLAAAIQTWAGHAERFPILKDKKATIQSTVKEALQQFDMVIVNAGTSAGRDDYTAEVLAELGEVLVHGIATKPGKPVILALCEGKPVIGLPGYPVSTMLTAELFVRDPVRRRQCLLAEKAEVVLASMVKPLPSTIGAEEYVRVSLGNVRGKLIAAPLSRGAGLLSSLTKAQGIVKIEMQSAGIGKGQQVPVRLLRQENPQNTLLAVGSHDLAVELLGVFLRRRYAQITLACANVGSMGGVMAIRNNEAHIAGVHMLDEVTGQYNIPILQHFFKDEPYKLVHMAKRKQGFMVPFGNPKNIRTLEDLTRKDVRFINRQRGSGTRMLLDFEIKKQGIYPKQICGYEMEVATHMAVAASVAAGSVDVGLGVQAAAKALGLTFVSVAAEDYDLLLNFADDDERFLMILDILKSKEFREEVESLGGYDLSCSGKFIL
ncbi:molybdopterin molybdochelatase [Propionispira arboris]|uniref:Molybdopterin molybdenumtransferase n=1 Tax=Propionispira arboris TaxID=84035 RepID=A0A1H6XZW8_9FIRM|nr:molybdopterin biosynthesis protein [Propionispira arboris]SEJ30432.1 molybdopterin molybdochelatase [Propionispira arboris]